MSTQIAFSERIISRNGFAVAGQPPIIVFDGRVYTVAVFHKDGGWFKVIFDNHALSVCCFCENELTTEQRSQIIGARPTRADGFLYYIHACGLDGYPDQFEWLEDEEEALAVLAAIEKAKAESV